jgi:hypothetical protein
MFVRLVTPTIAPISPGSVVRIVTAVWALRYSAQATIMGSMGALDWRNLVDQCASAVGELGGQRDIPIFPPTSDGVDQPADGSVTAGFTSVDLNEGPARDQK